MPQAATIAQYIKDFSAESPSAPQVFQWQTQPALDVQFGIHGNKVGDDVQEVILKIEVTAKSDSGTHFIIDLSYAGLFALPQFSGRRAAAFPAGRGAAPAVPVRASDRRRNRPEPRLPAGAARSDRFRVGLYGAGGSSPAGRRASRAATASRRSATPKRGARPDLMNLYRAIGSIGGLTMVSRVLGFARDMIGSRVLGASHANDAFNLAFLLPNIFRRLFAEGAFSSGFVPLFSRRLAAGGHEDAQAFSNEILAVFMPALLLVTLVFEIFMPGVLLLVVPEYGNVPGKFDAGCRADPLDLPLPAVHQPGCAAVRRPELADPLCGRGIRSCAAQYRADRRAAARAVRDKIETVRYMAIAVLARRNCSSSCYAGSRFAQAGVNLSFGRPRMTPAVRELVVLILPATRGRGRLPDQPALLRLFLGAARRRRAHQA